MHVSFATMKSQELESYDAYKIVEIWMACINCNQIRSGDMAEITNIECINHLHGKLLMKQRMTAAKELLNKGKYGVARRLLVDLRSQACQLYGPEHSVTQEIENMLKQIDYESDMQRLRLAKLRLVMAATVVALLMTHVNRLELVC
ncbi:hypothetical protein HJC23_003755 [Cyclotella cryptica]|uniref:Uncharacterized protein n=1 Tax=Cyclotella cryptica TaxID=29204 RepID=A0ABD3QUS4_9STRA